METLTPAERVLVADLRRALAMAGDQFVNAVALGDLIGGERWAGIAFGLVEALGVARGEPA